MHVSPLVSFEDEDGLRRVVVAAVFVDADESFPFGWGVGRLGTGKDGIG
jgi:hypothetical protein